MTRYWCEQCGSEIRSAYHNPTLPLDSFLVDYKEELNSNDLYCSYCSRNLNIDLSKWDLTTDIRVAHDSFSKRMYFSPDIINYSPIEFQIVPPRGKDNCKITLFLKDNDGKEVYRHSLEAKDRDDVSYIPPFSKNAIDFNWKYSVEGQDGVVNPDVSRKYNGADLTAYFEFHGSLDPDLLSFSSRYSKPLETLQETILENNI